MDIMDLNKLLSASENIKQNITIVEDVVNDSDNELDTLVWNLLQAWGRFDNYLFNLTATWIEDKEK